MVTFIFVLCMCCLLLRVLFKVTPSYFGWGVTGYKTGARYSQNASVKGSGRVPKSVHSPVISSTKKRSDIGVACTTIYL